MVTRQATFSSVFAASVLTALLVAAGVYRDDPKRLLRVVYLLFLIIGALVGCRYLVQIVSAWKKRRDGGTSAAPPPRPDLDMGKEKARQEAQSSHDSKAEDYETRIAGPRREEKFLQLENKMKLIRGFKGGGVKLGGDGNESRLTRDQEGVQWRGHGSLSHMTDSDQSDEEEGCINDGKMIRIALRLSSGTVYREFSTANKIRSLYRWLKELGYSSKNFVLVTPLPRRSLDNPQLTLEDSGITADTILVVDERD